MMQKTDRHFRYLARLLAPDARLYTEMLTARAILRGDYQELLRYDPTEHPLAVQLGGSDPGELAAAARLCTPCLCVGTLPFHPPQYSESLT